MMLNVWVSEIVAVGIEHTKNIPLGVFVGTIFTLELISILPAASVEINTTLFTLANALFLNFDISIDLTHVHLAFSGPVFDSGFAAFTQIQALGQGLYSHNSLGLLLASFVLLLAILGPILTCLNSTEDK